MADVAYIAKDILVAFIQANIPSLTVRDEFPYATQQLKYPSLTITTNKPKRTPSFPIVISQTAPNSSNQVVANEYVADWEDSFQLDLWARNKAERSSYASLILALFNSQETNAGTADNPDGLSLQMAAHFNEWARFEIDSVQDIDDEAASERQERRKKIAVLMNCREIAQRTYYPIQSIAVFNQATGQEPALTDDTTGTEEHIIF